MRQVFAQALFLNAPSVGGKEDDQGQSHINVHAAGGRHGTRNKPHQVGKEDEKEQVEKEGEEKGGMAAQLLSSPSLFLENWVFNTFVDGERPVRAPHKDQKAGSLFSQWMNRVILKHIGGFPMPRRASRSEAT